MKKLMFLIGVAVGFLLGSKVGHEPYAQMEKMLREFTDRPDVQGAMDKARGAAQEQVGHFSEKVSDKLPSTGGDGARTSQASRSSVLQRSAT
jgi:hypothetical protein